MLRRPPVRFGCLFVLATLIAGSESTVWAARGGEVELQVVEQGSGQPLAVRMDLRDERGRAVRPPKLTCWRGHCVFDGRVVLKLPRGNYTFDLERGPEYRVRSGYFTIDPGAQDTKLVTLPRFVDMKQEGWWSGDLHVRRRPEEIELLMRSEDLHVAPVITWCEDFNHWQDQPRPQPPLVRFDTNRYYQLLAGKDERNGGALLYFNLPGPLPIAGSAPEYPSPVEFLKQARGHAAGHVDIENPFSWDMPIWVASEMVHSVGLCHGAFQRDGVSDETASSKPRDRQRYPGVHGTGHWSQDVYYRLLDCGLRLPPSAGSGSGFGPNPPGYNRVYAFCGSDFSYEKWFAALRAGRVLVTNGPLLRPRVNGQLPGHVFQAAEGETVELQVQLRLSLRDPVDYLEVVQNGRVVHEVRLDEFAQRQGFLPPLKFNTSGWMLIRAVTSLPETYRFASTGPYYVEIGARRRISKSAAQFFLDWVYERARRLKVDDPRQQAEVIRYHRGARDFWQALVDSANAE